MTELPEIECKGLCHPSCGPIAVSPLEFHILETASGRSLGSIRVGGGNHLLETGSDLLCPLLKDGRCTVYAHRPLLCRLYGVADGLECKWGCKPDRLLSKAEVREIMTATYGL